MKYDHRGQSHNCVHDKTLVRGMSEDSLDALENYDTLKHLQNTRVLLIEDDRSMRRLVSKSIGPYCDLHMAYTAGAGVAKVMNFDPDIIFLDMNLPDNNGDSVLEWIMWNDPGAHVIVFSGERDQAAIQNALESGAQAFIPKPFDANKMMYHICQCPKLH